MPFEWAPSMKWPESGEDSSALLREVLQLQKEQGAKMEAAIEQLSANINALRMAQEGSFKNRVGGMPPPHSPGALANSLFGRCSTQSFGRCSALSRSSMMQRGSIDAGDMNAHQTDGAGAEASSPSAFDAGSQEQADLEAEDEELEEHSRNSRKAERFIAKWQSSEVFGDHSNTCSSPAKIEDATTMRRHSMSDSRGHGAFGRKLSTSSLAKIEDAATMKIKSAEMPAPRLVVLPNSKGRLIWDVITCLLSARHPAVVTACTLPCTSCWHPMSMRTCPCPWSSAQHTVPLDLLTPLTLNLLVVACVLALQSPSLQSRCHIASRSLRAGA